MIKTPLGLAGTVLLVCGFLLACGPTAGPAIKAEGIWSRPAMSMGEGQSSDSSQQGMSGGQGMSGTGAVFMVLVNEGREADRLLGGKTDVAQVVEIHETRMEGDVMKMQKLDSGLEIPANGQVELKPGGYHVMLIGLQRDLKPGDTFQLDLQFEKSGKLTVQPEVREP
jgi:hypothetical protein